MEEENKKLIIGVSYENPTEYPNQRFRCIAENVLVNLTNNPEDEPKNFGRIINPDLTKWIAVCSIPSEGEINNKIENLEEWHKIGDRLCQIFNICSCQRKLKTIIDDLYSIHQQLIKRDMKYNFTGCQWLIIAMLDKHTEAVTHGTNCEYPFINENNEIWKFILESHKNPHLKDN